MNRRYRKRGVATIVACLVLIAACGGDSEDDASGGGGGGPAAPDTVSIQICGGASTNFASYFVAEGDGLFDAVDEEFGTEISLDTSFGGGNECIAAFAGGENDMSSMSPALTAQMASQGEEVRTIMETFLGTTLVLVGAASEESARGTDLENWEGTTWATTGPGATTETVPKALMVGAGVDEGSLTFLPVGDLTAMTAALQTGEVDAVATVPAAAIQMVDAGLGYEILSANDPSVIRPLVGDILGAQGLSTTVGFLEDYPELTQAIVDAIHEGLRRVIELGDDAEGVLALFPEDIQEELGDGFAEQWAYTLPAFVDVDSLITAEEATATLEFQEDYADTDFSNVPDTFFDNTFAIQSYENLDIEVPAEVPEFPLQG